jgi:DNA-binding Lrp family transcriptional regulator
MNALTARARAFINDFQGGFPITPRPFREVASRLGGTEAELIVTIRELLETGQLSRFGPLYDAARLGGSVTLAALTAAESDFARVAGLVNGLPAVAHNYRRDHALNMWFVVASERPEGVDQCLETIARLTGLKDYNFPKLREFYLGLWLALDAQGRVDTVPVPVTAPARGDFTPDPVDRDIIAATQAGLPLVPEPYQQIAAGLGMPVDTLMQAMQRMLSAGMIRRIGAVPNHYRLGLRGNGMTVWDVPDELAADLGEQVGALDFVSHSYLRPRYPGIWPYNLFAMVHGHDRAEVVTKAERVAEVLGPHCRARDILFSTEVLKKTGLRLAA